METVLLVIVVVGILAYYGFMRSFEVGARIANDEVTHMDDVHQVSLIERTAKLNSRINDKTLKDALEAKARIKAMREGKNLEDGNNE